MVTAGIDVAHRSRQPRGISEVPIGLLSPRSPIWSWPSLLFQAGHCPSAISQALAETLNRRGRTICDQHGLIGVK